MEKNNFYLFGKIVKANRKTGELSLEIDVDDPSHYKTLKTVFLEIDGGLVPFFLNSIRSLSNNLCRIILTDYDEPDIANRFLGCKVFLPQELLPNLQNQKFQVHEIQGYQLIDESQGVVGVIDAVLEMPEQLLLQVMVKDKEVLIPLVDDFFVDLNREQNTITLDIPEGLVDLYLNE